MCVDNSFIHPLISEHTNISQKLKPVPKCCKHLLVTEGDSSVGLSITWYLGYFTFNK